MVTQRKEQLLHKRWLALGIHDDDIEEKFIRSSGPGGQHVNKTSTAVYLKHLPTGIEIKAQTERSQAANRVLARWLLVEKLEQRQRAALQHEEQRIEKLRRQNRPRPRSLKKKILTTKRKTGEKKRLRKTVIKDDE